MEISENEPIPEIDVSSLKFWTVQGRATDLPFYVQADTAAEAREKVEAIAGVFSRLSPPPIIKQITFDEIPAEQELL